MVGEAGRFAHLSSSKRNTPCLAYEGACETSEQSERGSRSSEVNSSNGVRQISEYSRSRKTNTAGGSEPLNGRSEGLVCKQLEKMPVLQYLRQAPVFSIETGVRTFMYCHRDSPYHPGMAMHERFVHTHFGGGAKPG